LATFTQTESDSLTLSDSATAAFPYAVVTDSVRKAGSGQLRLQRLPWKTVEIKLPVSFSNLKPGMTVWIAHKLMPDYIPSVELWSHVPLLILSVHDPIRPAEIHIKALDLRDVYATAWSPLKSDIGMTNDLNGIAIMDQGGGWQTSRDQLAYGERPGGDTVHQEILANTPIVARNGLRVEGGGDTNHLLNSTFSEGSGSSFTSWTYVGTGAAFAAEFTLYTLIDGVGFRRAAQLTTANAGEQSYLYQTVAGMGTKRVFVRVYYKNGGAVDDLVLRIQRSSDSKWWRDSDQTWQVAATDNVITPKSGVIDSLLYVTKQLDLSGVGATSLTIQVGHFSSAATVYQITQLQGVELIESPYADASSFVRYRSPLPTKAAAVTRVRNETWFVNDSAVRIFSPTRGFLKIRFNPNWSHEDLIDGNVKYVWAVDHLKMYLAYSRLDASTAFWRFTNGSGQYANYEAAFLAVRGQLWTLAARWTSETENEHDLDGQALDLWVLTPASVWERATTYESATVDSISATSKLYLGRSTDGDTTGNAYADGDLDAFTVGDHCPSEAELKRM
jgi:hypothetical protein